MTTTKDDEIPLLRTIADLRAEQAEAEVERLTRERDEAQRAAERHRKNRDDTQQAWQGVADEVTRERDRAEADARAAHASAVQAWAQCAAMRARAKWIAEQILDGRLNGNGYASRTPRGYYGGACAYVSEASANDLIEMAEADAGNPILDALAKAEKALQRIVAEEHDTDDGALAAIRALGLGGGR